jgi:hypothetical protein
MCVTSSFLTRLTSLVFSVSCDSAAASKLLSASPPQGCLCPSGPTFPLGGQRTDRDACFYSTSSSGSRK